ncbi:MAG: GGDEF domain-containing protein [Rhodospirillales bacterium]|nr:GGDEF domain-containing protein [Rhodospirillales bacterium]
MIEAAELTTLENTPHVFAISVINDLSERNITPTPENYTVWYCFMNGQHTALRKDIKARLKSNPNMGDSEIASLFETYFGVADHNKAIESITEHLIGELKHVLDNLSDVNGISGSYTESLEALSSALSGENNQADLQPAINAVAQATRKMAAENLTLGSQLTISTSEITQLKIDLEEMRLQAMTDGLTGIANRKCFDIELENAIQFSEQEKAPVCLLMLDIDHFKIFNDTHGHQIGDQVLKLLADILTDSVKGRDTPARYGGEEFTIILPETELEGAIGLAEALRSRIVRRPLVNKLTGLSMGKITISVGATQFIPAESSEDFIARADKALYGAKAAGRDQVIAV